MEIVFLLLPLALVISSIALVAFLWAVSRGQYDDLETPPLRLLIEDETPEQGQNAKAKLE